MMHRAFFRLSPAVVFGQRAPTRMTLRPGFLRSGLPRVFSTSTSLRDKCSSKQRDEAPKAASVPMTSLEFWSMKSAWKRASINTLRCLFGCTMGDFTALWLLQSFYADLGMGTIMAISSSCRPPLSSLLLQYLPSNAYTVASGLSTSMLFETTLLRFSRDKLPWGIAARTAAGMSFISMLTMEAVQNALDWHLTGGLVDVSSPGFWGAAALSMGAGYLAPLPYNYIRLRKYGKACH